MGAEQDDHLLPPGVGQEVQYDLAAFLGEVEQCVGCVVGAHAGQHVGVLGVGAGFEKIAGLVLLELLEHVGLQLGVGVDAAEELLLLLVGGFFDEVGQLGRLEPAQAAEARPGRQRHVVPDQGLDPAPVPPGVFASAVQEAAGVDVDGRGDPAVVGVGEPHVVCGDQKRLVDVDQAVTQDIVAKQDLSWATGERAQVQTG